MSPTKKTPGWDLAWMLGPCSDSQVCLRGFTFALVPDLWTEGLEQETMLLIRKWWNGAASGE